MATCVDSLAQAPATKDISTGPARGAPTPRILGSPSCPAPISPSPHGHRRRRSRIPVALVAPQGPGAPGNGARHRAGHSGGGACRVPGACRAAGARHACGGPSAARNPGCGNGRSASGRRTTAHTGRRGRTHARFRLHALRRPRRAARRQERRAEQALHRPALQRHGRAGHLHRRLRQARPAARGLAAPDGAVEDAGPVRRRRRKRRRSKQADTPRSHGAARNCRAAAPRPGRR